MQLKYPFPQQVRLLYLYCYSCSICGSNGNKRGGLELHHIWGRVSDSAFNSSILCGYCHKTMGHSQKEHQMLFKKTIDYLVSQSYQPTEHDYDFIRQIQHEL